MRNFVEIRDWRSRDAVMGTVLACLSVAHQNIQAAEIPRGMNWNEARTHLLQLQKGMGKEQSVNLLVMHDGSIFPILGSEEVSSSRDSVENKFQRDHFNDPMHSVRGQVDIPGNWDGKYQDACFVHTHPELGEDFFNVFSPPSSADLYFGDLNRMVVIADAKKEMPIKHAIFIANGGVWYYQFDPDAREKSLKEKQSVIGREVLVRNPVILEEMQRWVEGTLKKSESAYKGILLLALSGKDTKQEGGVLTEWLLSESRLQELADVGIDLRGYVKILNKKQRMENEMFNAEVIRYEGVNPEFVRINLSLDQRMRDGKRFEENVSWAMKETGAVYKSFGFRTRFVPSAFVNSEPPCAGADYPVEYSYDSDTHEWKIKKTK